VTRDKVATLARFGADQSVALTLLADEKAEIIGAFGLINERFPRRSPWYGIAHPAIFVIDPKGVVTHRFTSTSYRDRIDVDTVLRILRSRADG
jgi:peroxiredoxin